MEERRIARIYYLDKKFTKGGEPFAYKTMYPSEIESWTKILDEKKIDYEIFYW